MERNTPPLDFPAPDANVSAPDPASATPVDNVTLPLKLDVPVATVIAPVAPAIVVPELNTSRPEAVAAPALALTTRTTPLPALVPGAVVRACQFARPLVNLSFAPRSG